MAKTEGELCSIALARIGVRRRIDSLDEDSPEAQACRAVYALARDASLEAYDWPFARRRATLALLDVDVEARGWGFAYALPADFIAASHISLSGVRSPTLKQRPRFSIEGATLYTDTEDAELVYTARVITVGSYPPLFQQALAWKVAADLALVMPEKATLAMTMDTAAARALAIAAASAFNQEQADVEADAPHITVR